MIGFNFQLHGNTHTHISDAFGQTEILLVFLGFAAVFNLVIA